MRWQTDQLVASNLNKKINNYNYLKSYANAEFYSRIG